MEQKFLRRVIAPAITRLVGLCKNPVGVVKGWVQTRTIKAPISQCVHFCGHRYGRDEYNPYETYLVDLCKGVPVEQARQRFIDFLQHYRPRHFGAALGLGEGLSKEYPLLAFPWQEMAVKYFTEPQGWHSYPDACPDILTNFSEAGILMRRIEEEFFWLERALESIRTKGYQPFRHGSFIRSRTLRRADGTETYLLTDGNHRIAAMSALGHKMVLMRQAATELVLETECDNWFAVRAGFVQREDALRIFNAYFQGNRAYRTTDEPARLLTGSEASVKTGAANRQS